MSDVHYEKVISQNDEKASQLRLVLSVFKDVEYLHLRKYFLDYEGEWVPTKEGVSFPATIQSIYSLVDGLLEICANAEGVDAIEQHFADRIKSLKPNEQTRTVS